MKILTHGMKLAKFILAIVVMHGLAGGIISLILMPDILAAAQIA